MGSSTTTEWLTQRPKWLQIAAKRLLEYVDLNDAAISDLAELCQQEANDEFPNIDCSIPASAFDEHNSNEIRLCSISEVVGVNKLAPRTPLDFGKNKVAIVYGLNSSGKSGYVRLLKHVCGARDCVRGQLHKNVFSSKDVDQKAKISFLRDSTREDDNIPQEDFYQLIVDGSEEQVILAIEKLKKDLEKNKQSLLKAGELQACHFGMHLFQPLFHIRKGGKITILPVALNEREFQFVTDLKEWSETNAAELQKDGVELFLLRNLSRGKGVGFFEAGNFHPDFILWMIVNGKQYVTFIEPHGLLHEGPASEKVQFHKRIKDIENRFANPDVILNSFILSWTKYPQLRWEIPQEKIEDNHVLFMTDDRDGYINKLFDTLKGAVYDHRAN